MNYPIVLQHSEEDCGAACLATVSRYYGRRFSLIRIREAAGTRQLGTTLLGLRRGAETLGFNTRQVKASPELLEHLDKAPLPAIIHWQGNHWVVLYGKKLRKYVIADPAVGVRYLNHGELTAAWANRVMLLLTPDENRFYQQPEEKAAGIGRFLQRVLPYRLILIEVILLNLVIGLLALAFPFLLQILTDDVLVRGDNQLLTTVAIGVTAMNLFSSFLRFIQANLIAHFSQRLELGLVLEFCRQILSLPLNYYESRRSGEIVSRLRDIREINQLVSQVVIGFPSRFFIAVVSFGLMVYYSGKLTIVAILVAVMMSVSPLLFLSTLQQKSRALLVTAAENQGMLVETFKGALTLKSTNAKNQAWEEFQERFGSLANLTFSTIQISILNGIFSRLASGLGSIAILWFGSTLVIDKVLTIGQLLAFNSMNGNFTAFIGSVVNFVDEFARAKTAMQRLTEVIDSTPEEEEDTKKAWVKIPEYGDIICRKLNFHHGGRVDLLKDFSVTIPGGKVTAIIGQSGCGKSTLAKLIASLYQVQSGNISYGIFNQQDLALESLRQQVVLVPQEPHFWSRSILDNFRFSYPSASFEQIVTACKIVYADEFVKELPDKYQTVLGEFGANISGGQRQRLALARAIVNNPPVLILDESTGALDPVLEGKVLDKLLFYRQGKTTIMISHRPRVIMRANWIIFLEKGQLKLEGNTQYLQELKGEHLQFFNP
ncbi:MULTISPECIES: peptidase domain-containing ABC transporter [unclassified Moorena]|uniref:peptidase domain-containing ABC transporter n=1 Tax=unclassified Moorena TaxID=2683338 RepID=UPI0013B91556|nr:MULTISPECIES: peptidase domain-containing ABC transporter [unclassified Moorena]NEP33406.1 peptidase domain-containing ABC transporter [Moorena sp. SIO3B2]NEQ06077.1 peptidase domain-containing ABC transporter [Moorena sp. SIO4E2]